MRRPKWNAPAILEACRQFMVPRVVLTAVELDLFGLLTGKGLTSDQVAARRSTDPRATAILLDALAAAGFLSKSRGRYTTPASLVDLFDERSPGSVLPMARHVADLWHSWSHLTETVETGRAARSQRRERTTRELESFIGAMRVISTPVADTMARAIAPEGARRLLDVGAGPATYTMALVRQCPGLHATVFDLPAVIGIARREVRKAGLSGRFSFVAGDFYKDGLPGGHDLALLSAIIHQNSREQNRQLFAKIHAALVPGGRLVIRDHVMDAARTWPPAGALFAVNMLVGTDAGGCYTLAEIRDDLRSAGFAQVRQTVKGTMMNSLVSAVKRAS